MPSASRSRRRADSAERRELASAEDLSRASPDDEELDGPEEPLSDAEPEDLDDDDDDDDDVGAAAPQRKRISAADIARAKGDQPLDAVVADTRLRAIATDWGSASRNLALAIEALTTSAEQVAEFIGCDEESLGGGLTQSTATLEADMRALLDAEAEVKLRVRILHELRGQLTRGDKIYNAPQSYEAAVQAELEKYTQQTSRQKYASQKTYEQFREKIWQAGSEDPMPPMLDLIAAEEGDDDDDGDDIVMGGVTQDYKCPLSLRLMTDPLSSSTCSHSYERSVILDYLSSQAGHNAGRGGRGASVECPVSGCRAQLSKASLKENAKLKKDVRAFARRQEERELRRRATQNAEAVLD